MTFSWSIFATLSILAAAIHWIVGRAEITRPIWDAIWFPVTLHRLLKCPACSGWWLGLGLGLVGVRPMVTGMWWIDTAAAGLCAVFGVPVAEAVMLWGLRGSQVR